MKKLLFVLLSSICLMLCGCAEEEKEIAVERFFECNALMTVNGEETQFALERTGEGIWQIEFSSPKRLSGITFNVTPEEYIISMGELSVQSSMQRYEKSDVSIITQVLESAIAGKEFQKSNDGTYVLQGVHNKNAYLLTVDKNGIPLSLKLEGLGTECEFSEFNATV